MLDLNSIFPILWITFLMVVIMAMHLRHQSEIRMINKDLETLSKSLKNLNNSLSKYS